MKCIFCDQERKAWSITVTDDQGSEGICRGCIDCLAWSEPSWIKARGDQFVRRLVEALKKLKERTFPQEPIDVVASEFAVMKCEVSSITDVAISVTTDKGQE